MGSGKPNLSLWQKAGAAHGVRPVNVKVIYTLPSKQLSFVCKPTVIHRKEMPRAPDYCDWRQCALDSRLWLAVCHKVRDTVVVTAEQLRLVSTTAVAGTG